MSGPPHLFCALYYNDYGTIVHQITREHLRLCYGQIAARWVWKRQHQNNIEGPPLDSSAFGPSFQLQISSSSWQKIPLTYVHPLFALIPRLDHSVDLQDWLCSFGKGKGGQLNKVFLCNWKIMVGMFNSVCFMRLRGMIQKWTIHGCCLYWLCTQFLYVCQHVLYLDIFETAYDITYV